MSRKIFVLNITILSLFSIKNTLLDSYLTFILKTFKQFSGVKPCGLCKEEASKEFLLREKCKEEANRQKARLTDLFAGSR